MRTLLIVISVTGLLLTIVPSMLVFADAISSGTSTMLMAVGMVFWFATAPFWMNKEEQERGGDN